MGFLIYNKIFDIDHREGLDTIFVYPSTDNSKNHKGGILNVKFSYNTFSK
jgi:hypothetical protein